jgi:alpha-beta hydrolase superfamily lysophospholipase
MSNLGGVMLHVALWLNLLVQAGCGDHFILGANQTPIDPGGARREVIDVAGRTVECWVARSESAAKKEVEAFVLYFVGIYDRADRHAEGTARWWGQHGRAVEAWGMNYPGSGGSQGPPRLNAVGPCALGVFDHIRTLAGDRPIFVHAGSLGTVPALCVAGHRADVAGVVLFNPLPLRELILGENGWWNLWLVAVPMALSVPRDIDSIANAGRAGSRAVIVTAGQDEVIKPRYQRRIIRAYRGEKQVVYLPGARHHNVPEGDKARALAEGMDWLWEEALK